MLTEITFEQLLPIWRDKLWPNRVSKIEPVSAMKFLGGYDMDNQKYQPYCVGWIVNGEIVGATNGHPCADNSYRSRGVWVNPELRHFGIATAMLEAVIERARAEKRDFIWCLPKQQVWPLYEKLGYKLCSDWHQTEMNINAYCKIDLT